MGARGRKSASELTVVESDSTTEVNPRARPTAQMAEPEREVWYSVVNRMPADWFPDETLPMLSQFCRHVVAADRIANLVKQEEASDEFNLIDYDRLLKMQEREGRAISSLATRMRITQQSTYDPKKSKGKPGKRPWES